MLGINRPLEELSEYSQIVSKLAKKQTPVHIDGCIDTQKCHFISSIAQNYPLKLIITYNEIKAREIYEDYRFFDRNVMYYPAKDIIFYSADIMSNLIVSQRMAVFRRLMNGEPVTVVTTVDALFDRLMPLDKLRSYRIRLRRGDILPLNILTKKLNAMGYVRCEQVETSGEYAIRGGILDIYNLSDDCPYRVELWGDEIDSIRSFDVASQRSLAELEEFIIDPACEHILNGAELGDGLSNIEAEYKAQSTRLKEAGAPWAAHKLKLMVDELKENLDYGAGGINIDSLCTFFYKETVSFLDYFAEMDSLIVLDEPVRTGERAATIQTQYEDSMKGRLEKGLILPSQIMAIRTVAEVFTLLGRTRLLMMSTLSMAGMPIAPRSRYSITARSMHNYRGDFEMLIKELKSWKKAGYRIVLVCHSSVRAIRMAKDLLEHEIVAFCPESDQRVPESGEVMVIHGSLHRGIEYPLIKYAIISESDIFGETKKKKKKRRAEAGKKISGFKDLKNGDYVVHENYGVGIYRGLEKIEVDRVVKDYIKIEYSGGSNLYILATNLDVIQKFADKDAKQIKVNKMGGQDWHKTRGKVKGAVKELADDLIKLYAVRENSEGFACGEDTLWQREFEDMFPYEETEDQLDAIAATKRDMESTKIMDRLICGDVGFGKTEVAIRAAFKMVQEGRQCAVLVPTTILAQQHYNTFSQRMKDYPVNIGLLSRFRTRLEQKSTLKDLAAGRIDIVIGTHRLLSKDVIYKDLGLLVVDEEQRFGVSHKEKIKKIKETVDVLTLTATPIPRTMHMSLIGIRDMSLLEEAPVDRMPIQTYVMEYSEEMVREAIVRELDREGQVYYVYNRVHGIEDVAASIGKLVPDVVVAYAHGQMNERELENIMYQFINGEIDVLVATTIIETGLDIPNVNTMIIHDADRMGLAQLYQLRGRVGRSNRTAYAFLMYKRDKVLREVAEKRLAAIRDFSELGSGYKIAMRDLEIRGAGSLLGEKQSGHMAAVGYELYCKLLGTAVASARGEKVAADFDTAIELDIDAYIPDTYIKNEIHRLDMYKRIASIQNEDEYGEMLDELIDRYGELPKSADNLLMIALVRAEAHRAFISRIRHQGRACTITFSPGYGLSEATVTELEEKYRNKLIYIVADAGDYITVDMKGLSGQLLIVELRQLIHNIMKLLPQEA